MAVIPVAISVRRADLLGIKQDHSESARAFYAKVRGKASTCSYTIECTSATCSQVIDFINVMVKNVLISGLADEDINPICTMVKKNCETQAGQCGLLPISREIIALLSSNFRKS